MFSTILTILVSSIGILAFFKYFIIVEMRIDANMFKTLFDICKKEKQVVLYEEFVSSTRHPIVYNAFCFFVGAPYFYISHGERMLQAGWHGKDFVTVIFCFRWRYKALKSYLTDIVDRSFLILGVPVELMLPDFTDKIGELKSIISEPIVEDALWRDFDKEVEEVANKTRDKTSALLYGPPGNGKTYFIKYLATKYRLPIKIMTFCPDWNNHDLLLLFAQIPNNCIVLLEDFDNYFDKRKCLIGNGEHVKFTFDIILNGLDGVYNTYQNVVFIMTVNDIEKVDPALKNRPSRFKYTRFFDNPTIIIRNKILPKTWAENCDGLNLDQVFRMKEYADRGDNFTTAIRCLEKDIPENELKKIAYFQFEKRTREGIEGDHEIDWKYAENSLN